MSTELDELRESARRVLTGAGRAASEDQTWPLLQDLGWLLVAVPEAQDGLGQGLVGACAFHEELGRALNASPYLPALLAIEAVLRCERADRADWLRRLTAQERVSASLGEARLTFSDQSVSGTAPAVPSADRADHVLLSADDCVALVSLQQPGVSLLHRPTWDQTRRLFDVTFSDVAPTPVQVLARGAEARRLHRTLSTQRDFALAADAVGGAAALLELTVEYLQTRRQFGRPLALFQALKHRCADLKAAVSAAQALLAEGLASVGEDASSARAEQLGRGAKSLACAVYARVAEEALQLHGGIGMTEEHACHLFLKRALLNVQLGRGGKTYDAMIADRFLAGAADAAR